MVLVHFLPDIRHQVCGRAFVALPDQHHQDDEIEILVGDVDRDGTRSSKVSKIHSGT